MATDIPKVAFNNHINSAVLTNGRDIGDIYSVFNNDAANGFILQADAAGNATIDLSVDSSTAQCVIFGEHRYDESGRTIDFNFDLQAHDGTAFSSIKSGSFIHQNESMFNYLPAHTLAVPTAVTTIVGAPTFKKLFWTGDRFAAIDSAGTGFYTSTDGNAWTQDFTIPAGIYNDVKGLEDKFVLCGNAGVFSYFDGTAWTSQTITASNLNGVATNFISFVVVGESNEIWQSTDLITFSAVISPFPVLTNILGIDNSQFAYILRSNVETYSSFDDLSTFTRGLALALGSISDAVVYNGVYYACGSNGLIRKSEDYVNFDTIDSGGSSYQQIVVTDSELVTITNTGLIFTSVNNGTSYSQLSYSISGSPIDLASNGIDFFASTATSLENFFLSYRYRLNISGLTSQSHFLIPEIFIGNYLEIGHVDYGVDPKSLRSGIKKFNSENGRLFETVLWKRLELSFGLSVIDNSTASNIDIFRNFVYNTRQPIWFVFQPDSDKYTTYLMKVDRDIDLRIQSPVHKKSKIKFIEFI